MLKDSNFLVLLYIMKINRSMEVLQAVLIAHRSTNGRTSKEVVYNNGCRGICTNDKQSKESSRRKENAKVHKDNGSMISNSTANSWHEIFQQNNIIV